MNDENIVKILRCASDLRPPKPHPHDETEPCPGGCEDIKIVEDNACKLKKDITTLEGRIQEGHEQMIRLEARLDEGNSRMGRIEIMLSSSTGKLDKNNSDTAEILKTMQERKAGIRFVGYVGDFLKWVAGPIIAVGSLYLAFKDWIHK